MLKLFERNQKGATQKMIKVEYQRLLEWLNTLLLQTIMLLIVIFSLKRLAASL